MKIAIFVLRTMLAIDLLFLAVLYLNGWIVYKAGFNLLEYGLEGLFYLLVLNLAVSIPWKKYFIDVEWSARLVGALGVIVGALLLYTLVFVNATEAIEGELIMRAAFSESSDDEIAATILEHKNYYPSTRFIQNVIDTVPEDAAIAWVSDQRAHVVSYQFYPRKVYAIPELQVELNLTIQEGWDWMEIEDPNRPPMEPQFPDGTVNPDPSDAYQQALLTMIEEKQISWIVYYDSLHPERSWVHRIEP